MTVLREKAKLMNSDDLNRVIKRIAHEMVEQNKGTEGEFTLRADCRR